MCDSLSRRLSAEDFLLLGSVSGNGVGTVDLPRQSARYRSVPAFDAGQALSHGIPRQGGALYSGRRQRVARLANLRRLCPGVDRRCATVVCPRSHRGGSGAESVRVGLDHHRSLPDFVSLGSVSPTQSRGEDAYPAGPARQYPHVYPHHRRQSARRQHPRRTPSRSGRVLRDGSWLHRLPTPLLLHSVLRLLCRTYQRECLTPTALFAYGGQEYRRTFRSHRHPNRHGVCQGVSGRIAASELLRDRKSTRLKFLTNNFTLPALTIAQTYRCRWQVELFFRWIKQHLRIKSFFGTSENAVKTQIWIAVSVYVLVAIVRKRLGLQASLYQILQILSVTLFEKVPILQALEASSSQDNLLEDPNQLILFNF